jgi:acetyl-CoA hydrolase
MPQTIALEALDFGGIIEPGDAIVTSNGCGEALCVLEKLIEQRHALHPIRMFLGAGFAPLLKPEHADVIRFYGIGAMGARRSLVKAGALEVLPIHLSAIGRSIRSGVIPCDVAFIQIPPANSKGAYSWGLTSDYVRAAVETARVVVAEINDQIPWTMSEDPPQESELDIIVRTSRPAVEVAPSPISEVERQIAERILPYIPDRATLQAGIGAVPESVMSLMVNHRDLGIHSGMLGDSAALLMERGAVTNAHKEVVPGITLTATLIGTRRLYDFARNNPSIRLCSSEITHGVQVLAKLRRFVSINSAVEVDLTGQVNAEASARDYVGGVGGQVDYMRAAAQSEQGCAVIALPSTSRDATLSRIVAGLSGPVTTARSDVSIVVTEHGVADLRGKSLGERRRAMVAIAAPQFREELERTSYIAGVGAN